MCVFAFLTAGAISNSHHPFSRGLTAIVAWSVAGVAVIAWGDNLAWLGVIAFLATSLSLGFGGFSFPKGLEWDLWDRDDDDERVKVVH
jgi:hypothetical protein